MARTAEQLQALIDKIDAAIEYKLDLAADGSAVEGYSIDGISVSSLSVAELRALRESCVEQLRSIPAHYETVYEDPRSPFDDVVR